MTETMTENFWGEIPKVDKARTPLSILKEQAAMLGQLSNRLLEGEIAFGKSGTTHEIDAFLRIVAPSLGGYSIDIIRIIYDMKIYPLRLTKLLEGNLEEGYEYIIILNEEEFIGSLKAILSSDKVKRIISSLLIQIKSGDFDFSLKKEKDDEDIPF